MSQISTPTLPEQVLKLCEDLGVFDEGRFQPDFFNKLTERHTHIATALLGLLPPDPGDPGDPARYLEVIGGDADKWTVELALRVPDETLEIGLRLRPPQGTAESDASPEITGAVTAWLLALGESGPKALEGDVTFAGLGDRISKIRCAVQSADETRASLRLTPARPLPGETEAAPIEFVYPPADAGSDPGSRFVFASLPSALRLLLHALAPEPEEDNPEEYEPSPAWWGLHNLLGLIGAIPTQPDDSERLNLPALRLSDLAAGPVRALSQWAQAITAPADEAEADAPSSAQRAVALLAGLLSLGEPPEGAQAGQDITATLVSDGGIHLQLVLKTHPSPDGTADRLSLGLRLQYEQPIGDVAALQGALDVTLIEIALGESPKVEFQAHGKATLALSGLTLPGPTVEDSDAPQPLFEGKVENVQVTLGQLRAALSLDASGALSADVALHGLEVEGFLEVDRLDLLSDDGLLAVAEDVGAGFLVLLAKQIFGDDLVELARRATAIFEPMLPVVGLVSFGEGDGQVDSVKIGGLDAGLSDLGRRYGDWVRQLADDNKFEAWREKFDACFLAWTATDEDNDEDDDVASEGGAPDDPGATSEGWFLATRVERVERAHLTRINIGLAIGHRAPLGVAEGEEPAAGSPGRRVGELVFNLLHIDIPADADTPADAEQAPQVLWLPGGVARLSFEPGGAAGSQTWPVGSDLALSAGAAHTELSWVRGEPPRFDIRLDDLSFARVTDDGPLAGPLPLSLYTLTDDPDALGAIGPKLLTLLAAGGLAALDAPSAHRLIHLGRLLGLIEHLPWATALDPAELGALAARPGAGLLRLLARRLQETRWETPGHLPAGALLRDLIRGELSAPTDELPRVRGAGDADCPWEVPLHADGDHHISALIWLDDSPQAPPEDWLNELLSADPEGRLSRLRLAADHLDATAREALAGLTEAGLDAALNALQVVATASPEFAGDGQLTTENDHVYLVGPMPESDLPWLGIDESQVIRLPLADSAGPLTVQAAAAELARLLAEREETQIVSYGPFAEIARRAALNLGRSLTLKPWVSDAALAAAPTARAAARRLLGLFPEAGPSPEPLERLLRRLVAEADALTALTPPPGLAPYLRFSPPPDHPGWGTPQAPSLPDLREALGRHLKTRLLARAAATPVAAETIEAAETIRFAVRYRTVVAPEAGGAPTVAAPTLQATVDLHLGGCALAEAASPPEPVPPDPAPTVRVHLEAYTPDGWLLGDADARTQLRAVTLGLDLSGSGPVTPSLRFQDARFEGSAGSTTGATATDAALGALEHAIGANPPDSPWWTLLRDVAGLLDSAAPLPTPALIGRIWSLLGLVPDADERTYQRDIGPVRLIATPNGRISVETVDLIAHAKLAVNPGLDGPLSLDLTAGLPLPGLLAEGEDLVRLELRVDAEGLHFSLPVAAGLPLNRAVDGVAGQDLADGDAAHGGRLLRHLGALGAAFAAWQAAEHWLVPLIPDSWKTLLTEGVGLDLDQLTGSLTVANAQTILADPIGLLFKRDLHAQLNALLPSDRRAPLNLTIEGPDEGEGDRASLLCSASVKLGPFFLNGHARLEARREEGGALQVEPAFRLSFGVVPEAETDGIDPEVPEDDAEETDGIDPEVPEDDAEDTAEASNVFRGEGVSYGVELSVAPGEGVRVQLFAGLPDSEVFLPVYAEGSSIGATLTEGLLKALAEALFGQLIDETPADSAQRQLLGLCQAMLLDEDTGLLQSPSSPPRTWDDRLWDALQGALGEAGYQAGPVTISGAPGEVGHVALGLELSRADDEDAGESLTGTLTLSRANGTLTPRFSATLAFTPAGLPLAITIDSHPIGGQPPVRLTLALAPETETETQLLPLAPGLDPIAGVIAPLALTGLLRALGAGEGAGVKRVLRVLVGAGLLTDGVGEPRLAEDLSAAFAQPKTLLLGGVAGLLDHLGLGASYDAADATLRIDPRDPVPLTRRPLDISVLLGRGDETPALALALSPPSLNRLAGGLRLGHTGRPLSSEAIQIESIDLGVVYEDNVYEDDLGVVYEDNRISVHAKLRKLSFEIGGAEDSNNPVAASLFQGIVTVPHANLDFEWTPDAWSLRLEGSGGDFRWFDVAERLGPLTLHEVGLKLWGDGSTDGDGRGDGGWSLTLGLALNASFTLGPFSVYADGLSVTKTFGSQGAAVELDLAGLALSFERGPITIAGGFAKRGDPESGISYEGAAIIRLPSFELAAAGGFARVSVDGEELDSFYLAALARLPVGGPPMFSVQKIVAGVGIHRALDLPSEPQEVPRQALVQLLNSEDARADGLEAVKQALTGFAPSPGSHWFAAGVQFQSFGFINGILLAYLRLAASRGARFGVLGTASLSLPPPKEDAAAVTVAHLQVNLDAFVDLDGADPLLSVRAALTDSWVIHRNAQLTGGFALMSWFKRRDFVLTIGGYHPRYARPDHYPLIDRVGLNWDLVPGKATLKAEAYFALTPREAMAGGSIEVHGRFGPAEVGLLAELDILIGWDPFYYDVSLNLQLWVKLFGMGPLRLGVWLHIWGQPFAGRAVVSVLFWDIPINFGAHDQPKRIQAPTVREFLTRSLSLELKEGAADAFKSPARMTIVSGRLDAEGPLPQVGPDCVLQIDTDLPATAVTGQAEQYQMGFVPCRLAGIRHTLEVVVTRDGQLVSLQVEPLTDALPVALFGDPVIEDGVPVPADQDPTVTLITGVKLTARSTLIPPVQAPPGDPTVVQVANPFLDVSPLRVVPPGVIARPVDLPSPWRTTVLAQVQPPSLQGFGATHQASDGAGASPPSPPARSQALRLMRLERMRPPRPAAQRALELPQSLHRRQGLTAAGLLGRHSQALRAANALDLHAGVTTVVRVDGPHRLRHVGKQAVRVTCLQADGRPLLDQEIPARIAFDERLPEGTRLVALTGLGDAGQLPVAPDHRDRWSAAVSANDARGPSRRMGVELCGEAIGLAGSTYLLRGALLRVRQPDAYPSIGEVVPASVLLARLVDFELTLPSQARTLMLRARALYPDAQGQPLRPEAMGPPLRFLRALNGRDERADVYRIHQVRRRPETVRIRLEPGWALTAIVIDAGTPRALYPVALEPGLVEVGPPRLGGRSSFILSPEPR